MPLDVITHPLLARTRHGFFTRAGGASSGVFQGLNCGLGSSDQTQAVKINRDRVRQWMDAETLQTVHQHHSADVITVTSAIDPPKADGMVTNVPGIALGALSADCQPVLFHDADARVIGATHAGWKGARDGVLEATLDAMETIGAKRANIHAVIGPCISQAAYEVGPEFLEGIVDDDPDASRFFINGAEGKYQFDLPGFGLSRLRAAGVGDAAWTGHCTYSDSARFFSYRRSVHRKEADYGRLIACIRL